MVGDSITPIYENSTISNTLTDTIEEVEGEVIKYNKNTSVSRDILSDGIYLSFIELEDVRGDEYASQIVQFEMKRGKITNITLRDDLYTQFSND